MSLPISVHIDAKILAEFRKLEQETFGGILSNTLGIAGDAIGFFREKASLWYARNINDIIKQYREKAVQADYMFPYTSNNVPPHIQTLLMEFLAATSTVTDESLQELWAKFLVGSLKSENMNASSFINLIKSLTSNDVKLLDYLFKNMPLEASGENQPPILNSMNENKFPVEKYLNEEKSISLSIANIQKHQLFEFYQVKDSSGSPLRNFDPGLYVSPLVSLTLEEILFKGINFPPKLPSGSYNLYYKILPLGFELMMLLDVRKKE